MTADQPRAALSKYGSGGERDMPAQSKHLTVHAVTADQPRADAIADETTSYERLREFIVGQMNRDGAFTWEQDDHIADVLTPAIWNELHAFPLAALAPADPTADLRAALDAALVEAFTKRNVRPGDHPGTFNYVAETAREAIRSAIAASTTEDET